MKAALCVLLLATAVVYGAEEKKNEKRGVLGLGYGLGHAPVVGGYYGNGLGLYNQGLVGHGYYGGGLAAPLVGHGLAAPLVGHGLAAPLVGHGLAAPLVGHGLPAPLLSHGVYGAAPLHYGASPLLGLGHGYLH